MGYGLFGGDVLAELLQCLLARGKVVDCAGHASLGQHRDGSVAEFADGATNQNRALDLVMRLTATSSVADYRILVARRTLPR